MHLVVTVVPDFHPLDSSSLELLDSKENAKRARVAWNCENIKKTEESTGSLEQREYVDILISVEL